MSIEWRSLLASDPIGGHGRVSILVRWSIQRFRTQHLDRRAPSLRSMAAQTESERETGDVGAWRSTSGAETTPHADTQRLRDTTRRRASPAITRSRAPMRERGPHQLLVAMVIQLEREMTQLINQDSTQRLRINPVVNDGTFLPVSVSVDGTGNLLRPYGHAPYGQIAGRSQWS